ncbi:serine protease inhibitor Kazal-type 1-like [Drosophila teissieri]|uniref:serine protease inhibitor Kazal-type 1-like n=1 Tax=Drosophila teissieri TaxID=7243 RepID=UPI001CB9DF84|nr:serine protease inhibitor Kazal-type 1-like [Drosophila teissieri]
MKFMAIMTLLGLLAMLLVASSEASYCPCNLRKAEVCGTNGVTYQNRCVFECTQREYRKLGRNLNIQKLGSCPAMQFS